MHMRSSENLRAYWRALVNLLVGGNLLSLSLWRDPRRMVGYAGECWFLLKTYADRRRVCQKNVFEVIASEGAPSSLDVKFVPHPMGQGAWFGAVPSYTVDIVSLCLLCSLLKPKVVFEVGTLDGYTSLHLAMNAGPEAHVYTLDLPMEGAKTHLRNTWVDMRHIEQHERIRKYLFDGRPEMDNITCLFSDSATFDYQPYLGRVDLFFIDGAHSYEYVRSDTLNALRCCHTGSVIAWHDFGRTGVNGVSKWLVEFSRDHRVYSVPGGSLAFMVVESAPNENAGSDPRDRPEHAPSTEEAPAASA